MDAAMLDLELLRSFVSVVDAGGFTRAGERVHRTQSTVSQQIKRLEEDLGQVLLHRDGKDVRPTEAGERLLSYARRLLSLAEEARDVLRQPDSEGAIRLGIPEDFAAYRLAKLLGAFSRSHPGLRLDVRADQSKNLSRDLERGELDLALFKREIMLVRQREGISRAKALGKFKGRKPTVRLQADEIRRLRTEERLSNAEIARRLNVHQSNVGRVLKLA